MKRNRWIIGLLILTLSIALSAKNVILFIGDGMGPHQVSVANYIHYQNTGENLIFFDLPVFARVDTNNIQDTTTDSAAAGTALATGYRTTNGFLGLNSAKKPVENTSEKAKAVGKSVGIVTDTLITDATPAAFAAHTDSRYNTDVISSAFVDLKPDVFMGMGLSYFTKSERVKKGWDDRDLIAELKDAGYAIAYDKSTMENAQLPKLAGFFRDIDYAFARQGDFRTQPNLKEMTKKSLEILSQNEKGFFLMVEAAVIDGSGHNNDIVGTVYDIFALEEAVKEALAFQKENPDTLIIITADHETGGMSADPATFPQLLERLPDVKRIFFQINSLLGSSPTMEWARYVFEDSGIKVRDSELEKIVKSSSRSALIGAAITNYVGGAKYSTTGHSSQKVQLFAIGPRADEIPSELKNFELGRLIANFVTEN